MVGVPVPMWVPRPNLLGRGFHVSLITRHRQSITNRRVRVPRPNFVRAGSGSMSPPSQTPPPIRTKLSPCPPSFVDINKQVTCTSSPSVAIAVSRSLERSSARTLFEHALEQTRRAYGLRVTGYVVMPEHIHLLVSESETASLATALQALKQSVSRTLALRHAEAFWQARYYDFNVWSEQKRIEKLRYIHRNPVTRGLVAKPEDWLWSSFRHYATGVEGVIEIESEWTARKRERMGLQPKIQIRPMQYSRRSEARTGHPSTEGANVKLEIRAGHPPTSPAGPEMKREIKSAVICTNALLICLLACCRIELPDGGRTEPPHKPRPGWVVVLFASPPARVILAATFRRDPVLRHFA